MGAGNRRELDYFNAVGCLGVVLIHVLSAGISKLDVRSVQYALIFLPWQLAAYVVPGFLFAGAVKLGLALSSGRELRYGEYILRRIRKVLVPYLIWTLVYYALFLKIGYIGRFSLKELGLYVLRGNVASPFYYIVIAMQFYLLMPVWRWLLRRVPWYAGGLAAVFVTLLMTRANGAMEALGLSFRWFDRVFPTYLVFWVAGLYVGRHYDGVRCALTLHRRQTLGLFALPAVFTGLSYLQSARGIFIFDLAAIKIFSDLGMIAALMCLMTLLEDSRLRRLKRALATVHEASFFVYLSHALVLTLLARRLALLNITDMSAVLPLRAAVGFAIPLALWLLLHRLKKLLKK